MSNHAYDRTLEHENYVNKISCCECGYHRNGRHHPAIRCPKTGRCGECGNDWPCKDHPNLRKMYKHVGIATGRSSCSVNNINLKEVNKSKTKSRCCPFYLDKSDSQSKKDS